MSIYDQVLTFIHRPEPRTFDDLAVAVFKYQYAAVAAYRRYCEELAVGPAQVRSADDAPPVSNVAFKFANLTDSSASDSRDAMVFLTSGTTQGRDRRGRHVVPRPDIYRASAIAHLRKMLFPDGRKTAMLAMHPTADVMPESSLSTMISWCIAEFCDGVSLAAASREGVDIAAAIRFAEAASARGQPVSILGTTASFAALFNALEQRSGAVRLAPGSRMMDTGGAKGQAVPLQAHDVVRLASDMLAISPEMVVNEYGMTELCSQLYDATAFNCAGDGGQRWKIPPPWLRVTARDPATLRSVDAGKAGLLTFFDLANVGSVSAVMTEDVGIVEAGRVRVLGRSAIGAARGCALSIGQFAAAGQGIAR